VIENLLEIRRNIKERKPIFIRQDNPKRMKLNDKWRKPKGIHSKIRHRFKGRRKMPSPGYKSPRKVKGLHSSGLKIINVFSLDNLKGIKKENEGIVVAKNVGMRKQLEIFRKAKQDNIKVLNLNVDEKIKKIEEIINSKKKKEAKEKKPEIKEEKQKKKEKKEEVEKSTEENKTETKKDLEKKEKDKLLTKKA